MIFHTCEYDPKRDITIAQNKNACLLRLREVMQTHECRTEKEIEEEEELKREATRIEKIYAMTPQDFEHLDVGMGWGGGWTIGYDECFPTVRKRQVTYRFVLRIYRKIESFLGP